MKHRCLAIPLMLLPCFWACSALATEQTVGQAVGQAAIVIPVCKAQLTHLYVPHDRIQQVTGNEDEYYLQHDAERGQIYIKPLHAKRFTLFIQTEKGQHIAVTLTSQTHCLPSYALPEPLETEPSASAYETEIIALIEAMAKQAPLAGYTQSQPDSPVLVNLGDGLEAKLQQSYEGLHWQGEVYQLTNNSTKAVYFSPQYLEQRFNDRQTRALAYHEHVLLPGASLNLYKVNRHD